MIVRKLSFPALTLLLWITTVHAGPPKAATEKSGDDANVDPIYELADLASFGATIDRREASDCRAVSPWGDTLQRDRIVNTLVRLDRLVVSDDGDISALAKEIRAIALDTWCLNNAQYDFGYTLRNKEKLESDVMRAGMAYGFSSWLDEQPVETEVTGIANGRIYETRYYRSEASAETERREADLSSAIATLINESKSSKSVSLCVFVGRWQLQDRMAGIWRTRLWPVLQKRAGADSEKRLLRCSRPDSFPDKGLVPGLPYGSMMLASVGPKPLTRAAIQINWVTDLGDEGTWYAYFSSLDPRRRVLVLPHGEVGCALWGTCSSVKATVSVVCDRGQEAERSVSFGKPGAKSPQAKWTKPIIAQQRDRIKRENKEYLKRVENFIQTCRSAYPEPPNPDRVRARLAQVLGDGQKYIGWCKGKTTVPILVECEKFDGDEESIAVTLTWPGQSGVITEHCEAKLAPELERGVVLGMEHELLPVKSEGKSKPAPKPPPSRRSSRRGRMMPRPPVRKPVAKGASAERKLVTSPRSIENNTRPLDWADLGEIMAKGPSMPASQSSPVTWAIADYVLYVDESNRVILQIFDGVGTELRFVPLFPAEEKAEP